MKKFLLALSGLTIMSLIVLSSARAQRPIHEIHSMMIYNFTKYIKWPENSNSEFVIGVIADDKTFDTLTKWYTGKVKGGKKFAIKRFANPDQISPCDIIYVSDKNSNKFDQVKEKLPNSPTLIVTNGKGLAKKGSGINFKTVNNRLAFELNKSGVESRNLKISGQLLSIAIVI